MQGKRVTYRKWSVLIFLLLIMNGAYAFVRIDGGDEKGDRRDTVRAVVFYGDNDPLSKRGAISPEELIEVLDSLYMLSPIPFELIHEIEAYIYLRSKDEDQLVQMVDSLFELDTIPYAYIDQINMYIASRSEQNVDPYASIMIPYEEPTCATHSIYGDWNTKKPDAYDPDLSTGDSTLALLLCDPSQNCNYHTPFKGVMTSKFGWRDGRNHNGVDIDLEVWDPVHSAFSGVVRFAGYYGGWGRLVVVRHYNGLETYYAHLHRFKVTSGDVVEAGDVVGLGGSSGHSTGSHLHFEIRFKGIPLNPSNILSFKEDRPISDTLVLKKTRWSYAAIPMGTQFHKVEKGDYLHKIAEAYGTSISEICDLNSISRRSVLRVGQRLRVSSE